MLITMEMFQTENVFRLSFKRNGTTKHRNVPISYIFMYFSSLDNNRITELPSLRKIHKKYTNKLIFQIFLNFKISSTIMTFMDPYK